MGERPLEEGQVGPRVAEDEGQFDRGRDERGAARHHRETDFGFAGGITASSQRRLGPQRELAPLPFTPWGPSLRWDDEELKCRSTSPKTRSCFATRLGS